MRIELLISKIKEDLEAAYGVPLECQRLIKRHDSSVIRVTEIQTNMVKVGFDLALEWHRFHLRMAWKDPLFPFGLAEKWRKQLEKNSSIFFSFHQALEKLGNKQTLTVNGSQISTFEHLPTAPWEHIHLVSDSDYSEVFDANGFIYENFRKQVILFWGLMLSFIGEQNCEGLSGVAEGNAKETTSIRYERSLVNRQACIAIHGTSCAVCGISMQDKYGNIGEDFIEVHHIIPLSQYQYSQTISPATDLIPVCPNCHAMLHRRRPPYTIEELKKIMKK